LIHRAIGRPLHREQIVDRGDVDLEAVEFDRLGPCF